MFVEIELQLLAEGIISVRIPALPLFIHSCLRGLDCTFIDVEELIDVELFDYLIVELLILDHGSLGRPVPSAVKPSLGRHNLWLVLFGHPGKDDWLWFLLQPWGSGVLEQGVDFKREFVHVKPFAQSVVSRGGVME